MSACPRCYRADIGLGGRTQPSDMLVDKGSGVIRCRKCNGRGTSGPEACRTCEGSGYLTCPRCDGSGRSWNTGNLSRC
jgi:DnaJ-class molecular chaperone